METKLLSELNDVLKGFPEYWIDKKLNRSAVIQDLKEKKTDLLKALINNETVKSNYATELDDMFLFDFERLIKMLRYKGYWDNSYTRYLAKTGLSDNGKFISESTDLVLDFPFKDCILEGGLKKEELSSKEVYYNEVIARDERDRLLSPKALVNTKRYSRGTFEEGVTEISDTDNLIIRGNNLIALHSIEKRYEGKVKCIFIDPPYYFIKEKPADTFQYNSNFKLSSWLVFMKNRLEVAKRLLHEQGVIFITISDDGAHYLKVLCDSIFKSENFIADITWQSRKSVSSDGLISVASTHILTYANDKKKIDKASFKLALDIEKFKYEDELGKYRVAPFDAPNKRKNLTYEIVNPNNGEVYLPPPGRCWSTGEVEFKELLKNNRIKFGVKGTSRPQLKVYLQDAVKKGDGVTSKTIWDDVTPDTIMWLEAGTTTSGTKHQQQIFGEVVFENPKPESLVQRAIELSTKEGDIVLDFFLGSGTTAAAAHKMGRQYIGIEQMNYISTITIPRLIEVLDGENGGISKECNWEGGGSFIYTELMELNQYFVNRITEVADYKALKNVFSEMREKAHLNFQIDIDKVLEEKHEVDDKDHEVSFKDLSLSEQKQIIIQLLDKNQLYVCKSEINDATYNVSDSDKEFTDSFYNKA